MGVFSDDGEERNRPDNPRYTGEATECAVCGKHFIIGDMLYVIKRKSGEAVVCYYDSDGDEAKVFGKPSCLDEWYKQTRSKKMAQAMVFPSGD
ncbi:MAG: hypothetical protein HYV25_02625 [Candidatus Harrisonbacteria bacterium]|nr:hypothetical protein [Candidatus Harrisonbacteria bacterium]